MLRRIPAFADILPVLAVISAMFYGWSLVVFAYKFPGWLYYLTLVEIWGILAHQLMVNMLESLAVLALLLLACVVMPARFLRDEFPVRGTAFSIVAVSSMMAFLIRHAAMPRIGQYLSVVILASLVLAILAAAFSTRFRPIRVALTWLSDRLIVFLLVLVPLSALSMIYLLLRSILLGAFDIVI